jgi:hypothetical protein
VSWGRSPPYYIKNILKTYKQCVKKGKVNCNRPKGIIQEPYIDTHDCYTNGDDPYTVNISPTYYWHTGEHPSVIGCISGEHTRTFLSTKCSPQSGRRRSCMVIPNTARSACLIRRQGTPSVFSSILTNNGITFLKYVRSLQSDHEEYMNFVQLAE